MITPLSQPKINPHTTWHKSFLLWPTTFTDPDNGDKFRVWLQLVDRRFSSVGRFGTWHYSVLYGGKRLVFESMCNVPPADPA